MSDSSAPVAAPVNPELPSEDYILRHSRRWPAGLTTLDIELACFRARLSQEDGGLGAAGHFKEIVSILWPAGGRKAFTFHPWAEAMLDGALAHNYLAISGCANAGKSDFFAVYAIVQWLCAPVETMVLITSTSLKESRGRIWGSVEEYWNGASLPLPGKLVSSVGLIRLDDPSGAIKTSDRSGIHLIAGEKKKAKESIGKLIGLKNQRVFLIADELPELSPALLEAAYSNLAANPSFQLVGIGNPASIYDPHGIFSKPKNGWKSVTPADEEWETERGYHIRFDATRSPNVLAGRLLYPWLPTAEKLAKAAAANGEESVAFWRMWRGFWCPNGSSENIYAEADLVRFEADRTGVRWVSKPVDVAALDPGFTNGGDRSVLYFGKLGLTHDNGEVLLFTDYELLFEDAMKKDRSRSYQIADLFRERCKARGVTPDHAAFDATGAGIPFRDILWETWSKLVLPTTFGGKASNLPVSSKDRTPACEQYVDRVSELWGVGKEYLKAGQLAGVCPDLGQELTARKCESLKRAGKVVLAVESKTVMRGRTGKSPDIADAAFILLDLCRTRLRFRAQGRKTVEAKERGSFLKFAKRTDVFTLSGQHLTGRESERNYLDPAGLPG